MNNRSQFLLFQSLGWGSLFAVNFYTMWLSGDGAWQRSLNILVFATVALFCSFILRRLLKPIAQSFGLIKLTGMSLMYSGLMAMITVQVAVMLLAVLPESFGGKAEFNVNIFILITIAWAFVFAIWSLFYIVVLRNRVLKLSQANELRLDEMLNKARLNILHSQISPHFVFNSINNIRALVLEDKHKARQMLASLSEILRYPLAEQHESLVKLEEELDIVQDYIDLCSIQFESRLQFSSYVDSSCLNCKIPRMLLQMLVENAIKHGISESVEGGELTLSAKTNDNKLKLKVVNTGTLIQNANTSGVGLENIQSRLALIYQDEACFVISQVGDFVEAVVNIPLQGNDKMRGRIL